MKHLITILRYSFTPQPVMSCIAYITKFLYVTCPKQTQSHLYHIIKSNDDNCLVTVLVLYLRLENLLTISSHARILWHSKSYLLEEWDNANHFHPAFRFNFSYIFVVTCIKFLLFFPWNNNKIFRQEKKEPKSRIHGFKLMILPIPGGPFGFL